MNGVNLEEALQREKKRQEAKNPDQILAAFKEVLRQDDAHDEAILGRIFGGEGSDQPVPVEWSALDPERIYTVEQIKNLCTDYRLRFLDARYFKGEIPREAILEIKKLEKEGGQALEHFKIVAPAPLFHLEYKDKDPILFLPLGQGRYYLIHKWGRDLHPLRKALVFPFRNFKSLLFSVAGLAALIVMSIPSSVMMGPLDQGSLAIRVIFFFYLFIAFSALTALYGFSRMKNFNSVLWNSRYKD